MVRILIVDDKELVRSGLKMLLERHVGWAICGEAADGSEAIEKAVELQPDIILLDIAMPNLDGLSACRMIREKVPSSDILILTILQSLELARIAADSGAWGYVSKDVLGRDLISTIEAMTKHPITEEPVLDPNLNS